MPMITLSVDLCNPISQDFYDNTIYNLQFHQLVCSCGHRGTLTIHGYYYRLIKCGDSTISLRICRVICSACGHTHALLLSSIIPYSQVSTSEQISVICHSETDSDFNDIMDNTPSIDESCIRDIIRRFRLHWQQRLLSENLFPISDMTFINSCFSAFDRQFMQVKRTTNILFLIPT